MTDSSLKLDVRGNTAGKKHVQPKPNTTPKDTHLIVVSSRLSPQLIPKQSKHRNILCNKELPDLCMTCAGLRHAMCTVLKRNFTRQYGNKHAYDSPMPCAERVWHFLICRGVMVEMSGRWMKVQPASQHSCERPLPTVPSVIAAWICLYGDQVHCRD